MTQNEALAILESGQSVLLTGAAGTGKTYMLRKFIRRARLDGKTVSVTATTGLAATHLNGSTIHSWAGIGVHDELPKNHLSKISKQRRDIINKTDILIIDEISMMHDFRLDMIDQVLRHVRDKNQPLGGLQVVLCGDFFQLPPVTRSSSLSKLEDNFITGSQVWQTGNFVVCYLHEQYRQADDAEYTALLTGIRAGVLTRRQLDTLRARTETHNDLDATRTRLLTTNADVEMINLRHLAELPDKVHKYTMQSTGRKKYVEQLKRSCLAPETLQLKKGAIVMCIKNSQEKKYVNGSLGVIESFEKKTDYPQVRLSTGRLVTILPDSWELIDGDKHRASLSQLPLRLAWAITVHKSQGMTLDAAQIDLSNAFVEGMGYVALSRVRGLQYLSLDGLNNMALRVSPLAKRLDADLQARSLQAVIDNDAVISKWIKQEKNRPDDTGKEPKSAKKGTWATKLEKLRLQHPNAYRPWSEEDDEKLLKLFHNGTSLAQLTTIFGRHPGSVQARLQKHYGEDLVVK